MKEKEEGKGTKRRQGSKRRKKIEVEKVDRKSNRDNKEGR